MTGRQGERGNPPRTEARLVGLLEQGIVGYEIRSALEYPLSRKEAGRRRVA